MKWFRLYDDILDDPKVQRLPPELFKHWINLLCLANKAEPRGVLPSCTDVAFRLRISEEEAVRTLDALSAAGLIDQDSGDSAPYPHNWSGRQMSSDNVSERVRKHRQSEPPKQDETLPKRSSTAIDTDTDTDTERETEDSCESNAQARAPEPPEPAKPVRSVPKPRAQRLPASFSVADEQRVWATEKTGMPAAQIDIETEKFRDYYAGSGKMQVDWTATWRNWMRKAAEIAQSRAMPARAAPNGHRGKDIGLSTDDLLAIAKGERP